MPTGRNDPCPCGSEKRFKACCLPLGKRLSSSKEPSTGDPARLFHEFRAVLLSLGYPVDLAEVQAAVALVNTFFHAPKKKRNASERRLIGPFLLLTELVYRILDENGTDDEELATLFLPRLPFDVVIGPGQRTPADLLLERHGASLPPEAVDAVRALVEAEDAVCRVVRKGGTVLVEDLRTGMTLPASEGTADRLSGFSCRLVAHRGHHVPLAIFPIDEADILGYVLAQEEAAGLAAQALALDRIELRSRWKGVALGTEILEMGSDDDEEDDEEDDDEDDDLFRGDGGFDEEDEDEDEDEDDLEDEDEDEEDEEDDRAAEGEGSGSGTPPGTKPSSPGSRRK